MQTKLTPKEALIELNRLKGDGYMPTDWERRRAAIEMAMDALRKLQEDKYITLQDLLNLYRGSEDGLIQIRDYEGYDVATVSMSGKGVIPYKEIEVAQWFVNTKPIIGISVIFTVYLKL